MKTVFQILLGLTVLVLAIWVFGTIGGLLDREAPIVMRPILGFIVTAVAVVLVIVVIALGHAIGREIIK